VVTYHAITVTNYHFICSVVINAIFNTRFGSIICHIDKLHFKDIFSSVILNYLQLDV
jgi:hypothetical protein